MFWIVKFVVLFPIAIYLLVKLITIVKGYLDYLRFKKMGITYMGSFNIFRDLLLFKAEMKKRPNAISFYHMWKDYFGTDKLPPMIGGNWMGANYLSITSASLLQDLYVNKN